MPSEPERKIGFLQVSSVFFGTMEIQDLSEFSFDLPENQIAKHPSSRRDESRLLVLDRKEDTLLEEVSFASVRNHLKKGDVLIANTARVSKRRVYLKTISGRRHEALFLSGGNDNIWKALIRNSKKLKEGTPLVAEESASLEFIVLNKEEEFTFLKCTSDFREEDFESIGKIPIPPYFKRESSEEDSIRYQTVYAKNLGSVAAPTAGLHFTTELLSEIRNAGIDFVELELRVGYGTFQPLSQEHFREKKLHEESYFISTEVSEILNSAKEAGRRIVSVGTTTLRALESSYDPQTRRFRAGEDTTRLFLQPGDRISSCDGLITNFHLPESSLLLLVCAFAGKERVLSAYRYAVKNGFRFFSYGDAMLLL
ncbi:S-adenosylmethionine:tRNA ribosyltransferase-isomerase [Leptospira inadai serovar Lyme str. 10]|uniref:S-adenosylmethionine:tRNA ribosyltransferase-isomerase n=3 Tax=Leptospira inadai TaxID=29506 RepID=V6HBE3_9LEPT|nr:S-adenosylmethionine:tRNA ribosyltransferase-isomerase [Leptospira inadai serovar Lyme str. 10]PNV76890.1 S-adenosylmethionine:tRNA ribosyltransferase-isomerase [Leptospira inadai serovar Lyme]